MKGFSLVKIIFLSVCVMFSSQTIAQQSDIQTEDIQNIAPLNINVADAELIAEVLEGVGMSRASAIVNYREENGPFQNLDDLMEVKGIGENTVARNSEKILFE